MWLGYDKPLPERPPITPKKKHIKKRTSLFFLFVFFLFLGDRFFLRWFSTEISYFYYVIIFLTLATFGPLSIFVTLSFRFSVNDPYFMNVFRKLDEGFIRIYPFLVWQECWDNKFEREKRD
ncbi:hypothetical protein [Marinomonas aquiplantarum]|uniref:Uncharacterized protein n=1 Tax=Marinomonas aquiplantarum TaxID=491951 RepID=A0A366CWT9_9GAMM|nr:hypothetical protein [Marinomonas aquiplantarum]RBO80207.1 hypothetical protein DFP76_10870 [Marinomonas aquiplantarum]